MSIDLSALLSRFGSSGSSADYQRMAQMFGQLGQQGQQYAQNPYASPWAAALTGFASGAGQGYYGRKADDAAKSETEQQAQRLAEMLAGTGVDPAIASELGVDEAIKIAKMGEGASLSQPRQVFNPETGMTEWFTGDPADLNGRTVGFSNYGRTPRAGAPQGGAPRRPSGANAAPDVSPDVSPASATPNPMIDALTAPQPRPRPQNAPQPPATQPAPPARRGPDLQQAAGVPAPPTAPPDNFQTDRPIEADTAMQPDGAPGRFSAPPPTPRPDAGAPAAAADQGVFDQLGSLFSGSAAADPAPRNPGRRANRQAAMGGQPAAPAPGVPEGMTDMPTVPTTPEGAPDTAAIEQMDPGTQFTMRMGGRMVTLQVVEQDGRKYAQLVQ